MTVIDMLRWIGETSLAVGFLIVLILIIRKPFAKAFGARAAYALWLAPVLRVFLPELAILPPPEAVLLPELAWTTRVAPISSGDVATTPAYDARHLGAAFAVFIWFTVAFAWFNLKLEAQLRFMRMMMASSKPAPKTIMLAADAIKKHLGVKHALRIRVCDEDFGPSVAGLFRPVIFLPANFVSAYTAEERRLALAHEIAHIARRDLAATLAAFVFQVVQWPNPLVHVAFRLFRTDQEAACDAYVLACFRPDARAAGDYAAAILKSASGATNAPAFGLSLGHPIKERLMLLKNPKQSPLQRLIGAAGAAVLILGGLAVTASYTYAAETADGEEKTVKVKKERQVFVIKSDDDSEDDITTMVMDGDFDFISQDGEHKTFQFVTAENGPHMKVMGMSNCTAGEGEGDPVKLEWYDEESNDGEMSSHAVICLSGEEAADPKKRAEALRKAIDRMEVNAKKEEERRKKMIAGLRKQLRELEKKK